MASADTVKVRVFFYAENTILPDRMTKLIQLAYETATSQGIAPTMMLIRSTLHNSTQGRRDPKGFHGTFSVKYAHSPDKKHVTAHGYTPGNNNYEFVEATFGLHKDDSTPRGLRTGTTTKVVWPDASLLEEHADSPMEFPAPQAKGKKK